MAVIKPNQEPSSDHLKEGDRATSTRRVRATYSFAGQVEELEVGECCSRIQQLDPNMTMLEFAQQSSELKATLRNNVAPSVRGARKRTGGDYTIEVTTAVTTPGMVYLLAVVTRIS